MGCSEFRMKRNDWFPALRIRFRNRFRKTVSVQAVPYSVAGACSAAVARQAQEAGRRVSRAKEWAELHSAAGVLATGATAKRKNRTRSYMNGWTATANLRKRRTLFLRKLRSSYGILTDERNSCVGLLCYGYANGYGNGYDVLEIRHKSQVHVLLTGPCRSQVVLCSLFLSLFDCVDAKWNK